MWGWFQHQAHKCTDLHTDPPYTRTHSTFLTSYIMATHGIVVVHTRIFIVVSVVVRPRKVSSDYCYGIGYLLESR